MLATQSLAQDEHILRPDCDDEGGGKGETASEDGCVEHRIPLPARIDAGELIFLK
jgi:hypothetical protein